MINITQQSIIKRLQQQILATEGFKASTQQPGHKVGFAAIENHFPNHTFPTGTIHEFLCEKDEHSASTNAFIFGILSKLNSKQGYYLWIGKQRKLSPAGLKLFGILPHQIIFINLTKPKDILWATEEALKCKSLNAVISELEGITFAQSQRLQLTVEKSRVTGFILRTQTENISATACMARWRISPKPSQQAEELPGLGFTCWQVELLKVRNGSTANFEVTWRNQQFHISEIPAIPFSFKQAIGS